jgi:hypothetical protein
MSMLFLLDLPWPVLSFLEAGELSAAVAML